MALSVNYFPGFSHLVMKSSYMMYTDLTFADFNFIAKKLMYILFICYIILKKVTILYKERCISH